MSQHNLVLQKFAGQQGLTFKMVKDGCLLSNDEACLALQSLENRGQIKGSWEWGGTFEILQTPRPKE